MGNSPARRVPSHGSDMFGEEYALDLIAIDEQNRTSSITNWRTLLSTESPEVFYAFGQPVLSPITGTIVLVHDGEVDHEARRSRLALLPYMFSQTSRVRNGIQEIAGNFIVIKQDDTSNYIAIVHLQNGSINVSEGQEVSEGDYLASCGNSGNSTQPHIHIQAMDNMDFFNADGIPLFFRQFSVWENQYDRKSCIESIPNTNYVISPLIFYT